MSNFLYLLYYVTLLYLLSLKINTLHLLYIFELLSFLTFCIVPRSVIGGELRRLLSVNALFQLLFFNMRSPLHFSQMFF